MRPRSRLARTAWLAAFLSFPVLAACGDSAVAPPPAEPEGEPLEGVAVALTTTGACAVNTGRRLYCWGLRHTGAADSMLFHPWAVLVPDGPAFGALTGGDAHFCGVATDGAAYCWGKGDSGRLGTGSASTASSPAAVAGSLRFAVVSAGGGHTCAVAPTDATSSAGNLHCWGRGLYGEVGDGALADRLEPVRVAYPYHSHRYTDVAAGRHHSCGVTTEGVVRCWGWNNQGQLGVDGLFGLGFPEAVHSDVRFTAVTAGDRHSCAIAIDGTAWCWGRGVEGQLGTGDTERSLVPRPVAGGLRFRSLAAGTAHTCGLAEDGAAYCWGERRYGRVGDGRAMGVAMEPVPVAGGLRFRAIASGDMNSCGVAEDDRIYCWGYGGFGQLGAGRLSDVAEPSPVRLDPDPAP
jgi:alpha-tubulin suppressor-like RCC1 family protein